MALDDILKAVKKKLDYQKEAEVDGVKYVLSVLTLKEEQSLNAIPATDEESGLAYFNDMRKTLLSFAIKGIEKEAIPDIIETKDEKGELVKKERAVHIRSFLDTLPATVIESLFEIYVDLREEVENNISKTVKYKWFKDPEVREKEREEKEKKAAELAAATEKKAADLAAEKKEGAKAEEPIVLRKLPDEEKVEDIKG